MNPESVFGFLLLLTVLVSSCQNGQPPKEEKSQSLTEVAGATFGEPIDAEGAIALIALPSVFEGKDSARVKLKAEVAEVCQKKGCWMNLTSPEGTEVMVRFKDYGFFVPKDIAGQEAVVEGVIFQEEVSVEDLRHYAEDKGESQEAINAITEPQVKWTFTADGVLLPEAAGQPK